jgi:hypothetical protein
MSNQNLMEQVLTDLLPDLQKLHKQSRNPAAKRKILRYIERIHQALEIHDSR